jgi:CheY-like chemotaxis protein
MIGLIDIIRGWFLVPPPYRFDYVNAKRRCRILLIDDDPSALPLEDVARDEYNILQQTAVDPDLLRQCESGVFDIIILDYNGIAPKSITPDDGFGVFDRIRNSNPQQYVIAVSGQTYDISKTAYLKDANDWLRKPTDLATTKDKIDSGIRFLFDKTAVLQRLKRQLLKEGVNQRRVDRLLNDLLKRGPSDFEEISELVKKITKVSEMSEHVLGLVKTMVKIAQI